MNRGQLVTAVRNAGGWTADDGVLTDAILQGFVDEALRVIALERDWDWLATSETITIVAGTDAYTPASGWAKTLSLRATDDYGAHLRQVGLEEADGYLDTADGRGRPRVYTLYGGQIVLRPIPDAAYSLKHYYLRSETALANDSAEPLVPAAFHDAIVHLAASFAWSRKGDEQRSDKAASRFRAVLDKMADDARRTNRPRRVRPRAGYWS